MGGTDPELKTNIEMTNPSKLNKQFSYFQLCRLQFIDGTVDLKTYEAFQRHRDNEKLLKLAAQL